jgi:hypothetical protein
MAATIFLLVHTHTLPPKPLQAAVAALNDGVRPGDAVITNNPELTMPFAERYKGRAPVLGLNHSDSLPNDVARRLDETLAAHEQIWWLPNQISPQDSAIEQTLRAAGIRARNENFGQQRLALFVQPANLPTRATPIDVMFDRRIQLTGAAYRPTTSGGAALPLMLHWQAVEPLTADYHVFIHMLDRQDQLVAQSDGQPAQWARPTTTWQVGETITDPHGLWIPPDTAPGEYHLHVGLYQPATGARLHLPDGSDALELPLDIR